MIAKLPCTHVTVLYLVAQTGSTSPFPPTMFATERDREMDREIERRGIKNKVNGRKRERGVLS